MGKYLLSKLFSIKESACPQKYFSILPKPLENKEY